MPITKDAHLARLDIEARLSDAINHWRPDRPRRWLAKYGNLVVEGRYPIAYQFRLLRDEAKRLLNRPRTESANGLASHALHL